jgi:hypothetical protein
MRGLDNLLYFCGVLFVLAVFYGLLYSHGMAAHTAFAFMLLGGCILGLVLFTLRIGPPQRPTDREDRNTPRSLFARRLP